MYLPCQKETQETFPPSFKTQDIHLQQGWTLTHLAVRFQEITLEIQEGILRKIPITILAIPTLLAKGLQIPIPCQMLARLGAGM